MLLALHLGFELWHIFNLKKPVFKVNYLVYVGFEERALTCIKKLNYQKVEEFERVLSDFRV
jgi:hypothetical protein